MSGRMSGSNEEIDASSYRFAIVASRFHDDITQRLVDGALECFAKHGAHDVPVEWVPGAFELPLAVRARAIAPPPGGNVLDVIARAAGQKRQVLDAVVALGCIIRGGTPHFDFVATAAARGLMDVMLETGVPVAFGVLTTDDRAQAEARAGGSDGNKGEDAARTAIEMAALLARRPGNG